MIASSHGTEYDNAGNVGDSAEWSARCRLGPHHVWIVWQIHDPSNGLGRAVHGQMAPA